MKSISIWASKNRYKAIVLIIILEYIKGTAGFVLGNEFFPILSSMAIEIMVLSIIFLISFVQTNYQHQSVSLSKEAHYKFRTRSTGIIFLSSFLLSILLGNQFKGVGHFGDSQISSYAAASVRIDSSQNISPSIIEKEGSKETKKHHFFSKKTNAEDRKDGGKRVLYVLLFIASLIIAYFGVALSCGLACSGYGVVAILAMLVSLGIVSGGIYFLIRAFNKDLKPMREMSREEKKKERRKFFAIWGIVVGATLLPILASSL